jgi:hypothetical protein
MRPRTVATLCAIAIMVALAAPTASSAAGGWTLTQLPARTVGEGESDQVGLSGISCPSKSLCVAVSGFDTVVSSRSPTGGAGAWHVVTPPEPTGPGACTEENASGERVSCGLSASLRSISCASENLCVAVSWEGFAYVSTDPTGGAGAWSTSDLNEGSGGDTHLDSVSCPSRSLCVAVSTGRTRSGPAGGRILTTADPTSGHWQATQLDSSLDFTSVSCGSPSFCVAVAEDGRIAVSNDPTGGASAWRVVGGPPGAGGLGGVACAQTSLCVAGDAGGNLLASTAPGAPGAAWNVTNGGSSVLLTGVSCPTATRCVAVDNNGDVLASTDPAGGAGSWHFENLAPFHQTGLEGGAKNALFDVSCASPKLCVLVGADSRIFTSTEPFPSSMTGPSASHASHRAPRRPRTFFRWKEMSWRGAVTRRRHVRARFRFYSRTAVRGFECRHDRGGWRPCRSPLRFWVGHGHHVLRVRAIGPTGLRGPAVVFHFRVSYPRRGGVVITEGEADGGPQRAASGSA